MIITDIDDTAERIAHALDLFKGCQANTLGNVPNTMSIWHKYTPKRALPYHLHPEVSRIATKYHRTNTITIADKKFIDKVYTSTNEWLVQYAYVLEQWVKFPTNKPKTHNLITGNTFKR